MNGVVKGLCKGAAVSAVTVVIALTGVGFYLALMLLVIAMEEGGENLTVHALPFAQTTLLLAQGIGFGWVELQSNSCTPQAMPCMRTASIMHTTADSLLRKSELASEEAHVSCTNTSKHGH